MEVTQTTILDLLSDSANGLSIPSYQRVYSWTTRQCEELWLDVLRAGRDSRPHFTGVMLFEGEGSGGSAGGGASPDGSPDDEGVSHGEGASSRIDVIDGQQRLTTLTLLLLAFARHLGKEGGSSAVDDGDDAVRSAARAAGGLPHPDDIAKRFLLVSGAEDPEPRLLLSREDDATLRAELFGTELPLHPSQRVMGNLSYFEERMADPAFDACRFWDGVGRLFVLVVHADSALDAQEVFESVNSKGLPLSLADMVRNYLLLEEDIDEQERLYDEYWFEAESLFYPDPASLKLNSAIKAWLSIRFRQARIGSPEQVYHSFKRYVEDEFKGTRESVLKELRSFCFMWREQYRYHAVNKFYARNWAEDGQHTRTGAYVRKAASNEEYATRIQRGVREVDERW